VTNVATSVADLDLEAGGDLSVLLALWRARYATKADQSPDFTVAFSRHLIRRGEPVVAHEILAGAVETWPELAALRQLQALALARSGATSTALRLLRELRAGGQSDEETLGLEARIYKDQALEAEGTLRTERFALAYSTYLEAYRSTGGSWTGINAATMALLCGRHEQARIVAAEVGATCRKELSRLAAGQEPDYWLLVTLAESDLVQGALREAEEGYRVAAGRHRGNFGDLSSTRRNARLVCDALSLDRRPIDACFAIPAVAVCAGHMIDRPGRQPPRFPAELEQRVADELRRRLSEGDGRVGYASGACGTDILFLEAVLERQGEIRVVLPYDRERFVRDSVDIGGGDWRQRFERLLDRAAAVTTASEQGSVSDSASLEYVNRLLFGLAKHRADRLETRLLPMVVWDGRPGDGPGGTAAAAVAWGLSEDSDHVIRLRELSLETLSSTAHGTTVEVPEERADNGEPARTVAILFGDAVNFSKLTEDRMPEFVDVYLGAVGRLADEYEPLFANTWGDGLVFLFDTVDQGGRFALDLADRVQTIRTSHPSERPLPGLRLAVHAGPALERIDPVTHRPTFFGTHLTKAARIEPITPPGHVYASEAFAALASYEDCRAFICEYVGRIPLAKGFGASPLFHVRRRATSGPLG
jgi:class 3 adenylate cyclase